FEEAGWALAEGATYRTNVAGEEMTLKLTTTDASFRQTWAAVFEEQMKACGLQILRFHAPAAWFFGDSSGLRRRDFELAAYAWLNTADPGGRTLYQCDQIPAPENGWRGQNYMGWCNPKVDEAILTALSSLNRETRREAYRVAQEEYARDLPALPLFSRAQLNAANPALENFAPDPVEVYTWNAAQWVLPDQDTIVIGEGSEPASLFVLENSFVANVLKALVYGLDYTSLNYDFQPVMLAQFPTLENGEAARQVVQVQEGESVMDVDGNVVELKPGVILREAEGKEVTFLGGTIPLPQLVVTYTFVDGLRWSDGTPVSKADYEFAYRATCNSETGAAEFLQQLPTCEKIARIDFANDTAYVVTWKPGYHDPLYFLPPIPRLPAHQTLSDGRKLADVSFTQWTSLPEVVETPLGVGPYVVKEWVRGQHILFTASPSYYAGPPATPNLVVRFSHLPIAALAEGAIDVLGWDSIGPDQAEALLAAQSGGKARVYFIPSNTYEHVDFALFVK
ncbi:MAG: ABC transporter substrate-binding protein, partial [Anaerolineales bacterium]